MIFYEQYAEEIKATLDRVPWQDVDRVVTVLYQAWLANQQVFIMGNGGSAATAAHMACDLRKNTVAPGLHHLRVLSLNDNMALFSAHANDDGYENVFSEQLGSFMNKGDIVIAISASGNSPNVLKGVQTALTLGASTIGWSGYAGGKLAQLVDIPVVVPNHCIEQIEDVHLILEHVVTSALRQLMRGHAATLVPPMESGE
jgi:D-sedoheptulose 7-phosphate isomerase